MSASEEVRRICLYILPTEYVILSDYMSYIRSQCRFRDYSIILALDILSLVVIYDYRIYMDSSMDS